MNWNQQYDDTKRMLNIVRKIKADLREAEETMQQPAAQNPQQAPAQQQQQPQQPGQGEGNELSEQDLASEKQRFQQVVAQMVEFGPFKIYENTAEWKGTLVRESLAWVFSLDDADGCYVTADMMKLTTEALDAISKLRDYYQVWSKEWAEKVKDYQQNGGRPIGQPQQ